MPPDALKADVEACTGLRHLLTENLERGEYI